MLYAHDDDYLLFIKWKWIIIKVFNFVIFTTSRLKRRGRRRKRRGRSCCFNGSRGRGGGRGGKGGKKTGMLGVTLQKYNVKHCFTFSFLIKLFLYSKVLPLFDSVSEPVSQKGPWCKRSQKQSYIDIMGSLLLDYQMSVWYLQWCQTLIIFFLIQPLDQGS